MAVSYARLGLEKTGLLRLNKHQVTGLLAIEAPISMEFSLIVQYLVAQGIARDVFPFDKASHELTFGFKWEFDSGFIFEFGLIENLFIYDNSPDFGVHAGVVWSF